MKKLIALTIALSATTLVTTTANAGSGKILTDANGMTLYTFDKDTNGSSVCYGPCAEKWPPFIVGDNAKVKKGWGMTTRKDGAKQWTFNGQPLYTWIGDAKKGDTNGDGVKGVWHIARKAKSTKYHSDSSYSSSEY